MGVQRRQMRVLHRTEQGFTLLYASWLRCATRLGGKTECAPHHEAGKRPLLSQKGIYRISLTKKCQPCRASQGAWHILP